MLIFFNFLEKILEENISPIGRGPKLISDDSLDFLKKVADAYEKMLNTWDVIYNTLYIFVNIN